METKITPEELYEEISLKTGISYESLSADERQFYELLAESAEEILEEKRNANLT